MSYVNRIKDEGTRKVLTLRIAHNYNDKQAAQILGIQQSTAEKIGRKGALLVKELMMRDMAKQDMIFGQKQNRTFAKGAN